jgi:two-component system OmpR family response regulator
MKKKRILYAEDVLDLREITTDILCGEGYDCVAVRDGVEAQELLKTEKFDLLLTDFNMPLLDGTDLFFWCRQNGFHFPVIFITGSPILLPIQKEALTDCFTSMVNKPFKFQDLTHAIEQALNKAR